MPPQMTSQLKRDYVWNTASSIMGAFSLVLLQLMVTRTLGLTPAGVFAIAMTIGQQFQMLGAFEVRPYQATDVKHRFSFGTYHSARIITTVLMIVGIIFYSLILARPTEEVLVILLVGFLRVFDAFEDVFYGEFQRLGRLDIAGQGFFFRTLVTTVAFTATLVVTEDLIFSCLVTIALSLAATLYFVIRPAAAMFALQPDFTWPGVRDLLRACFPLFAAAFLAMYLANAPRFGIEAFLSDEIQAYYAVLFMPALAINILSLFIFRPLLTRMAVKWAEGDRRVFLRAVGSGVIGAAVAFLVTFVVTWAIGVPLLGFLYAVDLSPYLPELLVLVVGGGLNALGVVLYYALVTLRQRRMILAGYLAAGTSITLLCWLLIPRIEMMGAAISYVCAMLILALLFAGFLWQAVHRTPVPADSTQD